MTDKLELDLQCAMPGSNPLYRWLAEVRGRILGGDYPDFVESPFGVHGVSYHNDDGDGNGPIAVIGFVLPDDIYAEGSSGDYDELSGFRIYLGSE